MARQPAPLLRAIRKLASPLLMGALLVGCGGRNDARERLVPKGEAAPGFPRTVELPGGGRVELADRPRRVVVANTALVDAAVDLLPPSRVAAVCDQAITWSSLAEGDSAWHDRPTFRSFGAETMLAFRPDLVLCSPFSQAETVHVLTGLGIRVVKLADPTSLEQLGPRVTLLGRLLGAEDAAARLTANLDARIAALRERSAARDTRPSLVAYSRLGQDGWSMGADTLIHAAIQLAGFRNAVAEVGRQGPARLPLEDLLALDPDWLLVPDAFGEEDGQTEAFVRDAPHLAGLRARRSEQVLAIQPWLFSTTSHEIVSTAERLADALDGVTNAPATERR